jgi:hypothetical protein
LQKGQQSQEILLAIDSSQSKPLFTGFRINDK